MKKNVIVLVGILFTNFLSLFGEISTDILANQVEEKESCIKKEKYKKTRIFYKFTKKNDQAITGYLLGGLHAGFEENFYEQQKSLLKPYVEACKDFFFEIDVKKYSISALGTERLVLDLLDSRNDVEMYDFEDLPFQIAMINNCFWWGDTMYLSYFHDTENLNMFTYAIQFLTQKCIGNIAYAMNKYVFDLQKHIAAVQASLKKDYDNYMMLHEYYKKEQAILLSDFDNKRFLLDQRNQDWIQMLRYHDFTNPCMIVVGACHLPGEHGLVALLEQESFTVEPIKLWSK